MLHFLTTDAGQANLDAVAELIVSQKWRVPKSLVMDLSRSESIADYGPGHEDIDRDFFWRLALDKLGIPFLSFVPEDELSSESRRIAEVRDLFHGKTLVSGMPVGFEGEQYYLAGIGFDGREPASGETINMEDVIYVHLVPADFIDMDR